jgi:polyisoprenoid-binding protein YceI
MSWRIDPSHTRVQFSVRHMMIANVHGRFANVNGTVEFDPARPSQAHVDVTIDAASLDTGDPKRDAHLRSSDFFDVERFPVLAFKSYRAEKISETRGRLIGGLTIRGITREVVLNVEYNGQAAAWGQVSAGFTAQTKISRHDWDLTWNVALETGGVLVGDTVNISLELELIKQVEPELVLN